MLTPFSYIMLALAGFSAGFIDSIAGGGGIITVPALLWAGLPPHMALGTNKLQSSFGSLTASLNYAGNRLVNLRSMLSGVIFTALGAMTGTLSVQHIPSSTLSTIVPILLILVFSYTVISPRLGMNARPPVVRNLPFFIGAGLLIGFYDGFFGPGTGSFWTMAFVVLLGLDFRRAAAHTKIVNFTSNIVALVFFALGGHVLLWAGLLMGICQACGAFLGSTLVVRKGVKLVRFFFLLVVAITLARLVYVTYF